MICLKLRPLITVVFLTMRGYLVTLVLDSISFIVEEEKQWQSDQM